MSNASRQATGSFSPGELQILDFIMQTLVRGGSTQLATRHKEFASLFKKTTAMLQQLKEPEAATTLKLKAGRFYVTHVGSRWCCYRVDEREPQHCQAKCIQVATGRTEYFFLDGRYDEAGESEHTLVGEVAEGL